MSDPRATLVIAAYRSRLDHLTVAIRSALAQTERNIEIIVTDDSPDDALRDMVAGFRDPRLRYRHNACPLGAAGNHWAAFDEARGSYVAVLNHDDWIAPSFVMRLAAELDRHAGAVLAFCDHWIIDVRGRRLEAESDCNTSNWGRAQLHPGLHQPFLDLLGSQTIPMAMGTLMRRSALSGAWPDNAGPAYDLWLTYLLARGGGGAVYVAERLSAWRCHSENQTSAASLAWMLGATDCWHAVARDPLCLPVRDLARRKAALGYFGCAMKAQASGNRAESLRYAWRSVMTGATARGFVALLLLLMPRCWIKMAREARRMA